MPNSQLLYIEISLNSRVCNGRGLGIEENKDGTKFKFSSQSSRVRYER
ncbi:hypothetical protein [Anabaena sp. UHCC 0399]|nr:hypothetical protein [Anabaena sp. UHCC 0399]MEA5567640.1 hypothetical protein [Anabaena sp. UHCC 0399]UKP01138.1 hypothetical protein L6494_27320 [Nostoc sp. UHCC 0870]